MRRARPRADGFTLIELLVSFALLGLISVMLYEGIQFGTRAWERGSESLVATNDVAAVRRFLSHRLASAVAPRVTSDGAFQGVAFHGRPEGARFIADWPDHLGGLGPTVYELRYDRRQRALVLDWGMFRSAGTVRVDHAGRARPRVLLAEVEAVALRYFGRPENGETRQWLSNWAVSGGLPDLVELRVAVRGRADWPPLTVALAAQRGRASQTGDP